MKVPKIILVASLLLGLVTNNVNAQYYGPAPAPAKGQQQGEPSSPTGYFGLSIGLAAPIGAFGATSGSVYGGYAMPGTAFDISLGIPLNHTNIGIALMYGDYSNQFDLGSYVNTLQIRDQSRSYVPSTFQDIYNESFILGGLYWTWPIHRLSFDARAMGGIAICHLPDVTWEAQGNWDPVISNYDTYAWEIYSSNTVAFAFDIGGDIRYKLRRTSVTLGIDYTYAGANVSTTQQYQDQYGNNYFSHIGGGVPISVLCFNLGLAYEIK